MKKLVVLADLGRFKAFRMEDSRRFSNPRLELVEDWQTDVTQHLSDELSDQAGQYRRGVPSRAEGATAMSEGERHNIDLERRRRALKALARRIGEVINEEKVDACFLAADKQINQALINEMDQSTRSRIQKNVTANLTKVDASQVIDHFSE